MHIVFDLDGTLLCTEKHLPKALRASCDQLGIPCPDEAAIRAHIGHRFEDFCRRVASGLDNPDALMASLRRREQAMLTADASLYDGVPETLQALRDAGHSLYICSNGSRSYIDAALSATGIAHHFTHIVSGRDFASSKADALGALRRQIGDSGFIVVGDRAGDFNSAIANHLPSIGQRFGYGSPSELALATFVCETRFEALLPIVRRCALFEAIRRDIAHKRPKVVGINGIDTSGKTEFAIGLSAYLASCHQPVQTVHLDDFHNPLALRRQGANENRAYIDHAFNLEGLCEHILSPVKAGQTVDRTLTLLDLDSDAFTHRKHYRIDGDTLVMLEGVLLFREPVDPYIDYRIFIDIGFDTMLARAEARDVPRCGPAIIDKYRNIYIPIQTEYLQAFRPRERADVVVDNTDYDGPRILTLR